MAFLKPVGVLVLLGTIAGAAFVLPPLVYSHQLAEADRAPEPVVLGLAVRDVAADIAQPAGVVVTGVRAHGPADQAGIRAGDIITRFADEPVANAHRFLRLVHNSSAGLPVRVTLLRNGQPTDVVVTPREECELNGIEMNL